MSTMMASLSCNLVVTVARNSTNSQVSSAKKDEESLVDKHFR